MDLILDHNVPDAYDEALRARDLRSVPARDLPLDEPNDAELLLYCARASVPLVTRDRDFRLLAGVRTALWVWEVVEEGHGGVIRLGRRNATPEQFASTLGQVLAAGQSLANVSWVYSDPSGLVSEGWYKS